MYHLRQLHFALRPFFEEIGWKPTTYGRLFPSVDLREQDAAHGLASRGLGLVLLQDDESPDINELIRELNEGRPGARAGAVDSSTDSVRLDRWLQELTARAGSDLLLVAGAPPSVRLDGALQPLAEPPLSGDEIEEAVLPALAPHARARYRESGIADASHRVRGLGRFRINLHRERGRAAAAVRALPAHPPRLSSLGFPPGPRR